MDLQKMERSYCSRHSGNNHPGKMSPLIANVQWWKPPPKGNHLTVPRELHTHHTVVWSPLGRCIYETCVALFTRIYQNFANMESQALDVLSTTNFIYYIMISTPYSFCGHTLKSAIVKVTNTPRVSKRRRLFWCASMHNLFNIVLWMQDLAPWT